jgi:hypothetical protein
MRQDRNLIAMASAHSREMEMEYMSAQELLRVLRERAQFELLNQDCGPLGPDLFGLRGHPDPPTFLKGFEYRKLTPESMAPFFRAMSMTHPAPSQSEMRASSFTGGKVIKVPAKTPEMRSWDVSPNPHARHDAFTIPLVRHAIWLGSPLGATDDKWAFRNTLADSTRILAAESVTTVLLTDLPRTAFDHVRSAPDPAPGAPDPLADMRSMLTWAQELDIQIVNVDEYFNADNPLALRAEYATEMAKQTGNGYAAASDILRLHTEFYLDGDEGVSPGAMQDLRSALEHGHSFALQRWGNFANSMIFAPAGHWWPRAYIEKIRENYTKTQVALYGGGSPRGAEMIKGEFNGRLKVHRNSVLLRTGPVVINDEWMKRPGDEPYIPSKIHVGSGHSWFDSRDVNVKREAVLSQDEVERRVEKVAATLVRDLYNREGDLHLTQVAPVVNRLPDPAAAWEAVVGLIAQTPDLAERVRTITLYKLDMDDRPIVVDLPSDVRQMLAFDAKAVERAQQGGLQAGKCEWILGELVHPARILRPDQKAGEDLFTDMATLINSRQLPSQTHAQPLQGTSLTKTPVPPVRPTSPQRVPELLPDDVADRMVALQAAARRMEILGRLAAGPHSPQEERTRAQFGSPNNGASGRIRR